MNLFIVKIVHSISSILTLELQSKNISTKNCSRSYIYTSISGIKVNKIQKKQKIIHRMRYANLPLTFSLIIILTYACSI